MRSIAKTIPRLSTLTLLSLALALAGCGGGGSRGGSVASGSTVPASTAPATTGATTSPTPTPVPTPAPSPAPTPAPGAKPLVIAGWLPYWSTVGTANVKQHVGKDLDEVNAFWYGCKADGTLTANRGARDTALVAAVHNNKGLIVPTVFDVNDKTASQAVVASPALRAKLQTAILAEVDTYHYDGIDLDFESLAAKNRDDFSTFVTDLATALHGRGKLLSIAVIGKVQDKPSWGAAAALDFAAIGKAVDRFKIMAYGVHGSFSGPGPIGPLDWSERVVTFAVKSVPKEKVYLGIPFFGYDWPAGGKASAVTWSSAQSRIAKSTGGVTFSAKDGESTFTYVAAGVTHTVWFQDARGLAAKAQLAKRLGIAGTAAWAIGGEGADFFPTLGANR